MTPLFRQIYKKFPQIDLYKQCKKNTQKIKKNVEALEDKINYYKKFMSVNTSRDFHKTEKKYLNKKTEINKKYQSLNGNDIRTLLPKNLS